MLAPITSAWRVPSGFASAGTVGTAKTDADVVTIDLSFR
jgi:hypothetical protein